MLRASARHILVNSNDLCLEIKSKILAGEDFAELAKTHSLCPSKAQGGALGSFSKGQMVKEFDDVVFTAELNQLQGPIETQFGFHLVEVTNRSQ